MTDAWAPLHQEIDALQTLFAEAHESLKQGVVVDLSGLDMRIGAVCRSIVAAPEDKRPDFLPKLKALLASLNTYEAKLKDMLQKQMP